MKNKPTLTWKGRFIAFAASAMLCVVGIEGIFRLLEQRPKTAVELQLNLQPYMMFAAGPNNNPTWRNILTNTDVPSQMKFNNFGFAVDYDFTLSPDEEFRKKHAKKPGERVVVITGGSIVHGVGATANDKTIAGQLESILNTEQSKYKYRVVNLGMGSWIAYQQFIGLSLFGLPLDPDWVVVVDGHNDAAVACPHGSGAANPLGWPKMLYLTGGGEGVGRKSPMLQWLIRNTATARVVSGMQPTQHNNQLHRLYFDDEDPDKRFTIKIRGVKFAELDKQVDFYLLAQENVKNLFSSANIIYSPQPIMYGNAISPSYRKAYDLQATRENSRAAKSRLKADLDSYMAGASETKCNSRVSSKALGYFMARSAMRLEQVATEWSARAKTRSILFANAANVFPYDPDLRRPNFIDNAHMSDLGQRRVAEYFAGYILEMDLQVPFDPAGYAETVRAETMKLVGPTVVDPQAAAKQVEYQYSSPPVHEPPVKLTWSKIILEGVTTKARSPGALQIDEMNDYGYHRVIWAEVPASAGKDNTLTIDVWSDAIAKVRLEMLGGSNSYGRADFDLVTPKVIATNGKEVDAHIRDMGKGWKRTTLTIPLAANSATFNISLLSSDSKVNYTGGSGSVVITYPAIAPK